jgi:nitrogen regulatory protein PII
MADKTEPSLFSKLFSRLPVKLPGVQQGLAPPETRPGIPELKLIFFIVDWNRAKVISRVFEEEKVRFHFVSKGRGTASSEVLDLLGIGANDKAVIICLEQAVMSPILLKEVRKKLGFHSPGAGIAFTVPLSGINSPILRVFKQSVHKNEKIAAEAVSEEAVKTSAAQETDQPKSEGEAGMSQQSTAQASAITHDLIISIVNQGYSDELMNTARAAGATGGTVVNARGQAHEGAVKFFGVSVQDEKEMIIILANREKKVPIMRAVCEAHGLNSKAEGIVFSLPVDNVMGLSFE